MVAGWLDWQNRSVRSMLCCWANRPWIVDLTGFISAFQTEYFIFLACLCRICAIFPAFQNQKNGFGGDFCGEPGIHASGTLQTIVPQSLRNETHLTPFLCQLDPLSVSEIAYSQPWVSSSLPGIVPWLPARVPPIQRLWMVKHILGQHPESAIDCQSQPIKGFHNYTQAPIILLAYS